MWPFRRGRDTPTPEPDAGPESDPDPGPAGWETLPPLPATVEPPSPTFKIGAAVKEDLVVLRSPRLSSGLGHLVSADGPSGSVAGLVTPATNVQRRADSALDLRHPPAEPPTVQRQSASVLELRPAPVEPPAVQRRLDASDVPPALPATTTSLGLASHQAPAPAAPRGDAEMPAIEALSTLAEGSVQRLPVIAEPDRPADEPTAVADAGAPGEMTSPPVRIDEPSSGRPTLGATPPSAVPMVQRQSAPEAIGRSTPAGMPDLVPLRRVLAVDPSFTPPPRPVEATDPAPPPLSLEAVDPSSSPPPQSVETTDPSSSPPPGPVEAVDLASSPPPERGEATDPSSSLPSHFVEVTDPSSSPPPGPVEAVDPSSPPPHSVEAVDPAPAVGAEPPPVVQPEPEAPVVEPEPATTRDEFAIVQRSRSTRSTSVQRSPDGGTGLQRIVELPAPPPQPAPGEIPRSPGVQRRDAAPATPPPVQRMVSDVAGPPLPSQGRPEVGADVPTAPAVPPAPPAPMPVVSPSPSILQSVQRSEVRVEAPRSVEQALTTPAAPVQRSALQDPDLVAPLSVERSVAAAPVASPPSVVTSDVRPASVQRQEARDPGPAVPLPPPLASVERPVIAAMPIVPLSSSVQRSAVAAVMPTPMPLMPGFAAPPRTDPLPVARQVAPEPSPAPEAPAPAPEPAPPPPTPAPQPPAATTPPPAAAPAAATGDLDELARKLYDRIRWRLRAELRLDLERAGLAAGLRR